MTSNMRNIRIEKIAGMVHEGMIVADIGTDHAFLPVFLIRNGTVPKAYACDISAGPLQAAEKNISAAGFSDRIQVIQSDGLDHVPQDTEVIVIAGMGFETASGILEKYPERLRKFDQMIVEVNRDTIRMRKWISAHHFTIDDEIYVNEKGHDYIAVSFTAEHHDPYEESEIFFGPVLMQKKDPAYMDYLKRRIKDLRMILEKSSGKAPQAENIKKILKQYEMISG